MSIQQMLVEKQTNPNYVPPISDYQMGRRMFNTGITYERCTSDEMRSGWNAAEGAAMFVAYQTGGNACSDALALAVQ